MELKLNESVLLRNYTDSYIVKPIFDEKESSRPGSSSQISERKLLSLL